MMRILSLPHPQILFPNATLTINTTPELIASFKQDPNALVGAVPTIQNKDDNSTVLAQWGTAARVVRLIKKDADLLATLQGVHRIRLLSKLTTDSESGLPLYEISNHPQDSEPLPPKDSISKFKATALSFFDTLSKDPSWTSSKRDVLFKISRFLSSSEDGDIPDHKVPLIADIIVGGINADFTDKLEILSTPSATARLDLTTSLFQKLTSISEVSQKISSAVDESLSNQQKEFFLRQQLAAIQRELSALQQTRNNNGSLPSSLPPNANGLTDDSADPDFDSSPDAGDGESDDLNSIKQKILLMRPSSEERITAIREWKRLKRIPPGSVESGVVRTYLEWLTSLPWPPHQPQPLPTPQSIEAQPPTNLSSVQPFLTSALTQLNEDHYGLHQVKKRIIEYLAVVKLREIRGDSAVPTSVSKNTNTTKGPILLLVGPPGTGKTSLGASVARVLSLPFQRISLGGIRDEAEIRGHRRTYVASGPGRIVKALRGMWREVKEKDGEWKGGVVLLDEVDKIAQSNYHGDPAAALLEVLDPEQNHSFTDHYISIPTSLSSLLFILTANTLSNNTLPPPLLDRCEIIHLPGYTPNEKLHIGTRFLLPKLLKSNGLQPGEMELTKKAMEALVEGGWGDVQGQERGDGGGQGPGVRGLERTLGRVVRGKVVELARSFGDGAKKDAYNPIVDLVDLKRYLGMPRYRWEDMVELDFSDDGFGDEDELGDSEAQVGRRRRKGKGRRGVAYGLVVSNLGEGRVLPVESVFVPSGGGGSGERIRLTGMLGDVLKESAELALTWVKAHAYDLGITSRRGDDPFDNKIPASTPSDHRRRFQIGPSMDIHIHLPSGAQRKDGPSAGIAIVCALISLLTGHTIPPTTALTGEITLRGAIAPVGGIKAKLLGAERCGIKKVVVPWGNRRECVEGGPGEGVGVECVFVKSVREAVGEAFGRGVVVWRKEGEADGMGRSGMRTGMGGEEEPERVRSRVVPVLDESRL